MEKKITCTVCPMGCEILVTGDEKEAKQISGYSCPRGLTYAKAEYAHPVRILTTTVRTEGFASPLLAVRSAVPVPKEKIAECVKSLKSVTVNRPVKVGDVIVRNICSTGVDVVASANLK